MHQGEDGGVRADTQCQGQDRGNGETGRLNQLTKGVSKVVKQVAHKGLSVKCTVLATNRHDKPFRISAIHPAVYRLRLSVAAFV